jgi:hypothetical protein
MPRVGFEPTTPVFERAKTVHALHRADTVISSETNYPAERRWNFRVCILLCVIYRIYVYIESSLHNSITERTTKYTLICQHLVLFVGHATCFDPCFRHHQAHDEYKLSLIELN